MLDEGSGTGAGAPQNPTLREESMKNLLMQLWKEDEGQDLTEYALLIVLVALASITAMSGLATAISKAFSTAAVNLT
jgi:pilus assembly protein Flp/PilA